VLAPLITPDFWCACVMASSPLAGQGIPGTWHDTTRSPGWRRGKGPDPPRAGFAWQTSCTRMTCAITTPSRHEEDPWTKKQHKELRIKLYRAMMEKYGRKLFMDQQPAWDT
jgi:hypothetical protein